MRKFTFKWQIAATGKSDAQDLFVADFYAANKEIADKLEADLYEVWSNSGPTRLALTPFVRTGVKEI